MVWHYSPLPLRDKAGAWIGSVLRRDTGEIKSLAREIVLPQDPRERRQVLINDLKSNLTEVKKRILAENKKPPVATASSTRVAKVVTTESLVNSSEKLLEELEKASGDQPISEKLADRVLDALLPVKSESNACPVSPVK